jgi:hypothetical protein
MTMGKKLKTVKIRVRLCLIASPLSSQERQNREGVKTVGASFARNPNNLFATPLT